MRQQCLRVCSCRTECQTGTSSISQEKLVFFLLCYKSLLNLLSALGIEVELNLVIAKVVRVGLVGATAAQQLGLDLFAELLLGASLVQVDLDGTSVPCLGNC